MKTLIIANYNDDEIANFKSHLESTIAREDVIFIVNPKDWSDLEKQIKEHEGQFDRVFVNSHGGVKENKPTMRIVQKALPLQSVDIPIYNVVKLLNEFGGERIKEIHLLSCRAGFGFGSEESNQAFLGVARDGQSIIGHADFYASSTGNSRLIVENSVENRLGMIANAVINYPEAINVFHRVGNNYKTFSREVFTRNPEVEISIENLHSHLLKNFNAAKKFEEEIGIAGDPTLDQRLEDILSSEKNLRSYLSSVFCLMNNKVNSRDEELKFLDRWRDAIKSKLVDIDFHDRKIDATALYVAAQNGYLNILKELIAAEANIDATKSDNGATPLYIAARNGHLNIVKELIAAGANIDAARSDIGGNPLYSAAGNGHLDIVKELIAAGANIDAAIRDIRETPLYIAAGNGHLNIVKELIAAGANIDATRSDTGGNPLYVAAENGHLNITKELIAAGANVNAARRDIGTTPLHAAAQNGHLDVVKELITAGANIDAARIDTRTTPLYIAAGNCHLDIVKELIAAGANIDAARSDTGATPLYFAAENGHLDVVKELITAGVNIDATKSDIGATPLYFAAQNGHLDIVKELIAAEANVNAARRDIGATPLYVAAQNGHLDVVKELITAGANIDAARSDTGGTPLYVAAQNGHLDVVRELIKAKSNLNTQNNEGWSPLMHLLYTKNKEIIQFAIDNGADLEAKDNRGRTVLSLAKGVSKDIESLIVEAQKNKDDLQQAEAASDDIRRGLLENPEVDSIDPSFSPTNLPIFSEITSQPRQANFVTASLFETKVRPVEMVENYPFLRGGKSREEPATTIEIASSSLVAVLAARITKFIVTKLSRHSENDKSR